MPVDRSEVMDIFAEMGMCPQCNELYEHRCGCPDNPLHVEDRKDYSNAETNRIRRQNRRS